MDTIINNVNLDKNIIGFHTTNIEGRMLVGRRLETVDITNYDGDKYLGSTLPTRELTVHFILRKWDFESYFQSIDKLNYYLHFPPDVDEYLKENELKIRFTDEDYYRIGVLETVDNPAYNWWQGQGSFTLRLSDPFKYKEPQTWNGVGTAPETLLIPVKPDKITYSGGQGVDTLKITDSYTGKNIVLNGLSTQDSIVLDLRADPPTIKTASGQNLLDKLDIRSDFEDFEISKDSRISVSPQGSLEIEYREKAL